MPAELYPAIAALAQTFTAIVAVGVIPFAIKVTGELAAIKVQIGAIAEQGELIKELGRRMNRVEQGLASARCVRHREDDGD